MLQDIYRFLLEREGYRVLIYTDGLSSLKFLKEIAYFPDLVLVDCSMPQMDGETFLVKLKKELPQIFFKSKVVGFTGHDPQSSLFKKIKHMAFDCRQKPFNIDGILQIPLDYLEIQEA